MLSMFKKFVNLRFVTGVSAVPYEPAMTGAVVSIQRVDTGRVLVAVIKP